MARLKSLRVRPLQKQGQVGQKKPGALKSLASCCCLDRLPNFSSRAVPALKGRAKVLVGLLAIKAGSNGGLCRGPWSHRTGLMLDPGGNLKMKAWQGRVVSTADTPSPKQPLRSVLQMC